jgi:hypothetical protein
VKGKDLLGTGVSSIGVLFNYAGGPSPCGPTAAGGTFGWTWIEADCVAVQSFDSMVIVLYTDEDSGKVWFDKVKLTAVGP